MTLEKETVRDDGPVRRRRLYWGGSWLVTVFAVVGALLVGAVLIAIGDEATRASAGYFFSYPWDLFSNVWYSVRDAYVALLQGPSTTRASPGSRRCGRSPRRSSTPPR